MGKSVNASYGLDTSAFLRLLVGEPAEQAVRAKRVLDEIVDVGQQANVSDLVLSEAYFALQHHYGVPKRDAINSLRDASESREINCSESARAVLSMPNLHAAKPGFVDRLIHAEYRATGRRTITFEKAARKLGDALVL